MSNTTSAMKTCPHCSLQWEKSGKSGACPLCRCPDPAQKPSFESVWGQMAEEEFRKRPDVKKFITLMQWKQQALAQEDWQVLSIAKLLEEYPQFGLSLDGFNNLGTLMIVEDPEIDSALLSAEFLEQQAAAGNAAAQFARMKQGSQAWLSPAQTAIEENANPASVLSLFAQGKLKEGLGALSRQAQSEKLLLQDFDVIESIFGIPKEKEERLLKMKEVMEAEDMFVFLQCWYRPLDDKDHPFDHQMALAQQIPAFLETHRQSWKQESLDMIEADSMLNGMHLALQALQSICPFLEEDCALILEEHYKKIYMREYSELCQTDWNWFVSDCAAVSEDK